MCLQNESLNGQQCGYIGFILNVNIIDYYDMLRVRIINIRRKTQLKQKKYVWKQEKYYVELEVSFEIITKYI